MTLSKLLLRLHARLAARRRQKARYRKTHKRGYALAAARSGRAARALNDLIAKYKRQHRFGAGGFAPTPKWRRQRVDQGQDFEIPIGQHLRAPGGGKVIQLAYDGPFPNGFGSPYAVVAFTSGPFNGLTLYLGHVNEDVPPVGIVFRKGDRLGRVTNSLNPGWGWAEIGLWPPGPDGNGQKIAHLFREVGA